jgi:hypothetical protein
MTKYTTLSEELNQLPRDRQELISARASQIRLEEITLRHLKRKTRFISIRISRASGSAATSSI